MRVRLHRPKMMTSIARTSVRGLASKAASHQKYDFYDLLLQTQRNPIPPPEPESSSTSFEGAYALEDLTPEERISRVFGGRIRGDVRQSSSRFNVGDPRIIAGVKVPAKPIEPNNCCMSGCINCVWEMYNDDIKDWNDKRKEAAGKLAVRGGIWPADFDPPVRFLNPENMPGGNTGGKVAEKAKVEAKQEQEDEWANVPVSIRVFAEMERKKKLQKEQAGR